MYTYTWKKWKNDGEFKAVPGQEISAEVYDIMRRCAEPLLITPPELVGMEEEFMMGQETGNVDGKPLRMAFGRKGKHFYYLGENSAHIGTAGSARL